MADQDTERDSAAPAHPRTVDEASRQRLQILDITADLARRLDFESVARRIVDAVTEVTDFRVATVTVRDGDRCRRAATAGLAEGRIGLITPFERWTALLNPAWRCGGISYLVPPEAPAQWADIPDIPPSDHPDAWTAAHGLVLTLLDDRDDIVGFLTVDEPRSGRLPDAATVETLEVFARQAQVAFVNARLYALANAQAATMAQLFEVAKTMATTSDFDEVVPRIVTAVRDRLDAYEVTLVRAMGGSAELRRCRGDADDVTTLTVPVTGPLQRLADALRATGSLLIDDVGDRPDLARWLTPGTRTLMVAGKVANDELAVALAVTSDRPAAFGERDAAFLEGLLDITVVAIRNANLYEEVRFAAERDALTGLRNRRLFWSTLHEALDDASRRRPLALAIVDIDDFKQVNDQHGHDVGDRALRHVAVRLEGGIRETDSAFRIGGEEFVLVMPNTSADGARTVLGRIAQSVKRSRLDLPTLTVSAGVAVAPHDAVTADELFSAGDAALYRAKRAGKDRTEFAGGARR